MGIIYKYEDVKKLHYTSEGGVYDFDTSIQEWKFILKKVDLIEVQQTSIWSKNHWVEIQLNIKE